MNMQSEGLEGLRILVVGAVSGIGAAVSQLCGLRGARVIGADRASGEGAMIAGDITDPSDCARIVREAVELLGGLDGLAVTVGGGRYGSVDETSAEELLNTYNLNVVGPALLVREASPHLRESKDASVVMCASAAGINGYPNFSAYGSAKAALLRWTRGTARELALEGVRVNCVSPGPIDTPLLRDTYPEGYTSDEWAVEVAKNSAMRRAGKPEEVAEAITFLLSRRSSYITGVILPADGGEVA